MIAITLGLLFLTPKNEPTPVEKNTKVPKFVCGEKSWPDIPNGDVPVGYPNRVHIEIKANILQVLNNCDAVKNNNVNHAYHLALETIKDPELNLETKIRSLFHLRNEKSEEKKMNYYRENHSDFIVNNFTPEQREHLKKNFDLIDQAIDEKITSEVLPMFFKGLSKEEWLEAQRLWHQLNENQKN